MKSNIGDLLNVVVQLERRPGRRFVSEVLEIQGYNLSGDRYDFHPIMIVGKMKAATDLGGLPNFAGVATFTK